MDMGDLMVSVSPFFQRGSRKHLYTCRVGELDDFTDKSSFTYYKLYDNNYNFPQSIKNVFVLIKKVK